MPIPGNQPCHRRIIDSATTNGQGPSLGYHSRHERVLIVGGGFRRIERGQRTRLCAAHRGHAHRSPEPSPVSAAAVPGGDRRPEPRRDRRADPQHPLEARQYPQCSQGEVTAVHLGAKRSRHRLRHFAYDWLILACGSLQDRISATTTGRNSLRASRTLEQATEIRRRILLAFEEAERSDDLGLRKYYLTFVIVGGRPDGSRAGRRDRRDEPFHSGPRFPQDRLEAGPRDPGRVGQPRILARVQPRKHSSPCHPRPRIVGRPGLDEQHGDAGRREGVLIGKEHVAGGDRAVGRRRAGYGSQSHARDAELDRKAG